MKTEIITTTATLPQIAGESFFHSRLLMDIYQHTVRHTPYIVIVHSDDGEILAHLMAVVRNGKCRIFGEGDYDDELLARKAISREEVFGEMLQAIENRLSHKTLYIEVSDLSRKMFAYRQFKKCGFFPINWLQVHNSLHSHHPKDRISRKILRRIAYARKMGATTSLVSTDRELQMFYSTIRTYYNFHLRKFCPAKSFFCQLMQSGKASLFLTTYHDHPIAAFAIVYSCDDAYLWFGASKKKSHPRLAPDILTIWNILNYCHANGIHHLRFMDVGLPFLPNAYYDCIMQFGGKSVGTYRWFRFHPSWLNSLIRMFLKIV